MYHSDRRWHLFANKKTPCQPNLCGCVLQKSWWCGVCSSRNCSVPNVVVSTTKAMTGSVTKTLVDGFHHANHHLSKRVSQILVVWCSSQKPYSTNIGRIITGTLSQPRTLNKVRVRTNTSEQYNFECRSATCVHPETTQCNICKDNRRDGFQKKKAHQKLSSAIL